MQEDSGLDRWFKEKWVDISKKDKSGKHPPCGRKDADKGKYPKCRPSKRVSKKTPKTSKEMSKSEKEKANRAKRKAEKKPSKSSGGKARKPKRAPAIKRKKSKKSKSSRIDQIRSLHKASSVPYLEENGIRKFSHTLDSDELIWHRDAEDRQIEVLAGEGWMIQYDNELPHTLENGKKYFIKKNSWHRVIRGSSDLIIKINKV